MPNIIQYTQTLHQTKFQGVVRTIASHFNTDGQSTIAIGTQEKKLFLTNNSLQIQQEIVFTQWVRCVAFGDLDDDGNAELIAGSGDQQVHIYKISPESNQYEEICTYKFDHFVSDTKIVDVTENGKLNVIVGSWDKTVHVFDFIDNELREIWTQTFDDGVLKIITGKYIWNGHEQIGVFLKKGGFILLDGRTGDKIMSIHTDKAFIAGDFGYLDESGYPFLVAGGNGKIIYIFDHRGILVHEIPVEDRITSLKISDIDGDNQNDLLVGLGSSELAIFKIQGYDMRTYAKKWFYRLNGAVNSLLVQDLDGDGQKEIIFGGYDRKVSIIQDNYYGEVEPIIISKPSYLPNDDIFHYHDFLNFVEEEFKKNKEIEEVETIKSEENNIEEESLPKMQVIFPKDYSRDNNPYIITENE